MLRYIPSISNFIRVFYHEEMLNCVKGLSIIYQDDHTIYGLYSIYILDYDYRFAYVELSLHPEWNQLDHELFFLVHVFY
jgi:hypothetical protein